MLVAWPADARPRAALALEHGQMERTNREHANREHANREPFGPIPRGPVQIIIAIDQQKLHLYSDGAHVTDTLVATGVPTHPTPLGIFDVIQKSRFHRSNIYSNAPMPYMQRITWSGVALHEGVGVGHRASHGCVRMPREFAIRLWALTRLGAEVVIADPELRPEPITDVHLFVHKQQPKQPSAPPPVASAPDPAKPLIEARSVESGKASDVTRDYGKDQVKDPVDPAPPSAAADPPGPAADQGAPAQQQIAMQASAAAPAEAPAATPPVQPIDTLRTPSKAPIAIFISRKDKKIFVRQNFAPLFSAPVIIEDPAERCGTHIFTALDYLDDGSTLRWNVISLPGERAAPARRGEYETKYDKFVQSRRRDERAAKTAPVPPPQTPQQALARVTIPPDVIERISELIIPGSSLIVSDQGLGEETGEGTDFIVVKR